MSDRFCAINHDGEVVVHATSPNGNYATLCGASDDDDPENGQPAELPKRPKITCEDCQAMILHGRTYTKRDFSRRK